MAVTLADIERAKDLLASVPESHCPCGKFFQNKCSDCSSNNYIRALMSYGGYRKFCANEGDNYDPCGLVEG